MADESAPVRVVEWLLGPVAGTAAGFFAAGRKASELAETKRRVEALELAHANSMNATTLRQEALRSEMKADLKEARVELLDAIRDMRSEMRDEIRQLARGKE